MGNILWDHCTTGLLCRDTLLFCVVLDASICRYTHYQSMLFSSLLSCFHVTLRMGSLSLPLHVYKYHYYWPSCLRRQLPCHIVSYERTLSSRGLSRHMYDARCEHVGAQRATLLYRKEPIRKAVVTKVDITLRR